MIQSSSHTNSTIRFGRTLTTKEQKAYQTTISESLKVLEKDNLFLAIHDQSFPSVPTQDIGRGSPYSGSAKNLMQFVHQLGFNGIQFGPQGMTSENNQAPYDGTLFSKNWLSIALEDLSSEAWGNILPKETIHQLTVEKPAEMPTDKVAYSYVYQEVPKVLWTAYDNFKKSNKTAVKTLQQEFQDYQKKQANWLDQDALMYALSEHFGTDDWKNWPEPIAQTLFAPESGQEKAAQQYRQKISKDYAKQIEFYQFCQFILHKQHASLRDFARNQGLAISADLQVGISNRDSWTYQSALMKDFLLGAPPSSTNPDGQPWAYSILDPAQLQPGKPAYKMMEKRLEKIFSEFDYLRIDHPHGLVDPFGYEPDGDVKEGHRIFSSPEEPKLKRYARINSGSIDYAQESYSDHRVKDLTPQEVDRYSVLLDLLVRKAKEAGHSVNNIICEVLSTQPYTVQRVAEKFGLGRFRVAQSANPNDPKHVYHPAHSRPQDWAMVSTHDKPPLQLQIDQWKNSDTYQDYSNYLIQEVAKTPESKKVLAERLANDPLNMITAKFAELFASPAKNLMVFFPDVFGIKKIYNKPGIIDDENWTLRLSNNFEKNYYDSLIKKEGLNIPDALALAMQMRGEDTKKPELFAELQNLAEILQEPEPSKP